ncbi:ABC transporter permease [Parazoarcus communis]|uniref:ABC transporter permease n=1 Tax=Parazoarcus communis TaxID=41977 RepID=A0A2U8H3N3_9RHOO|nr:ABC transporter permease [Parazoarcus communis]AWI80629.1 ABC transporter permease [Parazoarcus communis]
MARASLKFSSLRMGGRYLTAVLLLLAGVWLQRSGLIDDLTTYWGDIVYLTGQHIELTLISGGLAILAGIPIGVLFSRPALRRWADGLMQTLNIGTTIPTLAVLALSMSFLGIGSTPAIFALWVASLLYIVRNTYSGLTAVPDHLIEAANGMGMRPAQILLRVELPNALFVMFAGVRTALAINVGTVPLAFLIGGGGLGELIFTGIDLNDNGMMLAGAIPTAALAVAVDALVGYAAFLFIPRGVNPLR